MPDYEITGFAGSPESDLVIDPILSVSVRVYKGVVAKFTLLSE
jgi:hypothetical protein